jgi:hypothetical protein
MIQPTEAIIEPDGSILARICPAYGIASRLVTILEDEPASKASVTALLSEHSLAEDWNRPEEDEAWSHLQQAQ